MSVEADIPADWECPRCGAEALSTAGILPEEKAEKPARTHWDMLLERRSEKELEDILKERLELLRGGEIGPAHLHRANKQEARQPEAVRLSLRPSLDDLALDHRASGPGSGASVIPAGPPGRPGCPKPGRRSAEPGPMPARPRAGAAHHRVSSRRPTAG